MMEAVNDFLFTYLDSIDERLLEYFDEDDELKLDAVKRLRFYTSALLEGSISPDHVMEDWPDWYQLVPAFTATYGSEELQELEGGAEFLRVIEERDDVSLTCRATNFFRSECSRSLEQRNRQRWSGTFACQPSSRHEEAEGVCADLPRAWLTSHSAFQLLQQRP
jgi:hypothetical protein